MFTSQNYLQSFCLALNEFVRLLWNYARVTRSVIRSECSVPKHRTQFGGSSFSCESVELLVYRSDLVYKFPINVCLSKCWLLRKRLCTLLNWKGSVCMYVVLNRSGSAVYMNGCDWQCDENKTCRLLSCVVHFLDLVNSALFFNIIPFCWISWFY